VASPKIWYTGCIFFHHELQEPWCQIVLSRIAAALGRRQWLKLTSSKVYSILHSQLRVRRLGIHMQFCRTFNPD
jgi:hypothetical protein